MISALVRVENWLMLELCFESISGRTALLLYYALKTKISVLVYEYHLHLNTVIYLTVFKVAYFVVTSHTATLLVSVCWTLQTQSGQP